METSGGTASKGDNSEKKRGRPEWIKSFSRYALDHNLMVVAYFLVRLYFFTIRVEWINEDAVLKHLQKGGKLIAALWHQRIIPVISYARRFSAYRPSVMISRSRDGDLVADLFSRMGFRPVRGSSSRDGSKALQAMLEDLKHHPFAVHILDGPQGPQGVIKPGLVVMAMQSGAAVIPVYASVSRAWILKNWDRSIIPKPFSRIVIRWDDPISVPREMTRQRFEEIRSGLERHMLENQREEDRRFGWQGII